MKAWKVIATFPKDSMPSYPVLLFNKNWGDEYNLNGIVEGFWDPSANTFCGAFWNNYQDTWDCQNCEPTHWMEYPDPPTPEGL